MFKFSSQVCSEFLVISTSIQYETFFTLTSKMIWLQDSLLLPLRVVLAWVSSILRLLLHDPRYYPSNLDHFSAIGRSTLLSRIAFQSILLSRSTLQPYYSFVVRILLLLSRSSTICSTSGNSHLAVAVSLLDVYSLQMITKQFEPVVPSPLRKKYLTNDSRHTDRNLFITYWIELHSSASNFLKSLPLVSYRSILPMYYHFRELGLSNNHWIVLKFQPDWEHSSVLSHLSSDRIHV